MVKLCTADKLGSWPMPRETQPAVGAQNLITNLHTPEPDSVLADSSTLAA